MHSHTHLQVILFLQKYAFLLKDARNSGKMFEGERDKKKKVYPLLPDGNKRVHLNLFYVILVSFRLAATTSPPNIFGEDILTGIVT